MKSVIVLGTIRNVSKTIKFEILKFNRIFSNIFDKVDFFLVESDSDDRTILKLESLKLELNNFEYESLGNLFDQLPSIYDRLAFCRNRYVEHLKSLNYEYDYSVVMDFDDLNTKLTEQSILEIFNFKEDWDVITANQKGPYYDIVALRHYILCPNNPLDEHKFYLNLIKDVKKSSKIVFKNRQLKIPIDSSPIRVDSAFGGFAIFNKGVLRHSRYSGKDSKGNSVCEHVMNYVHLKKNGFDKIFILPKLINAKRTEHTKSYLHRKLYGLIIIAKRIFLK